MDIVEELMKVALFGSAWVLYLLLFLSVLSFAAMIERWWFFRKEARGREAIDVALDEAVRGGTPDSLRAKLATLPGLQAGALAGALRFSSGGPSAISEALEAELADRRARMERSLTLLGTLGNNAPFVGLFGTVLGVIEAFRHLGDQSEGAMANVMAGIAEALIATGVGIFVAIPAVVAFNYAQARIDALEGETTGIARRISAWLRTRSADGSVAAPERTASERSGSLEVTSTASSRDGSKKPSSVRAADPTSSARVALASDGGE
jgi:biopolymer transport protein ExbB/biopolymer transport protein TolQ